MEDISPSSSSLVYICKLAIIAKKESVEEIVLRHSSERG